MEFKGMAHLENTLDVTVRRLPNDVQPNTSSNQPETKEPLPKPTESPKNTEKPTTKSKKRTVFSLPDDAPRIASPMVEKVNRDNYRFIKYIRKNSNNRDVKEKWCEPIYVNVNCRKGRFFTAVRSLPKSIGPGPLSLVIKETLNYFIKSCKKKQMFVFNRWRFDRTSVTIGDNVRCVQMKAKTKKMTHYSPVRIITHPEDLAEFCREMCVKADACPNLFGPKQILECPECKMV